MKIVINRDFCQGHAVCVGEVPEVFKLSDDGVLIVIDENPPEELRERLMLAARYCPTGSISIVEDE